MIKWFSCKHYLALIFPATVVLLPFQKNVAASKYHFMLLGLHLLIIGCFLFALVLLQCRTAFIGIAVSVFVILWWRYRETFRRYKHICITAIIAIVVSGAISLYLLKSASADGRWFIWKISMQMIADKPLFGFGYNMFERNYNLYQANYFKNNQIFDANTLNAQHVYFAYNELIQNTIDGGFVGLAFFILFVGVTLFYCFKIINNATSSKYVVAAVSGIVGFVAMSFVNFTITVIPFLIVLSVYLAIIIKFSPTNNFASFQISQKIQKTLFLLIAFGTVWFIAERYKLLVRNFEIQKIYNNKTKTSTDFSIYEPYFQNNPTFLDKYARQLKTEKKYIDALYYYKQSTIYNTTVSTYIEIGKLYELLNDRVKAEKYYTQAVYQMPILYRPRMTLLSFYLKTKQTKKAKKLCAEVIQMPIKIPSPYVSNAKEQAQYYFHELKNKN